MKTIAIILLLCVSSIANATTLSLPNAQTTLPYVVQQDVVRIWPDGAIGSPHYQPTNGSGTYFQPDYEQTNFGPFVLGQGNVGTTGVIVHQFNVTGFIQNLQIKVSGYLIPQLYPDWDYGTMFAYVSPDNHTWQSLALNTVTTFDNASIFHDKQSIFVKAELWSHSTPFIVRYMEQGLIFTTIETAVPTPEPTSFLLAIIALCFLVYVNRHKLA